MGPLTDLHSLYFSESHDLLIVSSQGGRVIEISPSWTTLLGYTNEDLLGQPILSLVDASERSRIRQAQEQLHTTGEIRNLELRFRAKNGSTHWISWNSRYLSEQGITISQGREISGQKYDETVFERIIEQLASETGDIFLSQLVRILATDLGWELAFISRCNQSQTRAQTLRLFVNGSFAPNVEYDLSDTPCQEAIETGSLRHLNISESFAASHPLSPNPIQAYVAQTIYGGNGRPIAIVGLMHSEPRPSSKIVERLLRILAVRVGSELERHEHERRLLESERRYRFLTDSATDMITQHDMDGRFTFVGTASIALLGYLPEELTGISPYDMIHADDLDIVRSTHQQMLDGASTQRASYRFRTKAGRWRWLETIVHTISDATTGKPVELLCVSRDVTQRKLEEEELRKEHSRQMLHVRHTPLAVIEMNTQGEIVFWNPSAERIFGYTTEQAKGRHFSLILPEDQRSAVDKVWERLITQKGGFRNTNENCRSDGRRIWCEWYNTPLIDANGSTVGVASLALDITEKKRAEELVENQRLQMMAASKMSSLGEMAAGIAHEINNPLAIIFGRTENLARLAFEGDVPAEKVHSTAEKINSTAQRIARIIAGLRFFARDGAGDRFERRRVRELVDDTLAFCQSRFRHHDVKLIVDPVPEDLEVECRAVQISQVLLNLLNNAFDAVENLHERWVRISVRTIDDEVELRLTDSGVGIPAEIVSRIMLPFFTTKDIGKGTGLGLSIARGILEAHHGRIELDRKSPHTCFIVRLPKKQPASDPPTPETSLTH